MFKLRYDLTGPQEEELRAVRVRGRAGFIAFWERVAIEYRVEPATVVVGESAGGAIWFDAVPLPESISYASYVLSPENMAELASVANVEGSLYPNGGNQQVRDFWNRMAHARGFIAVSVEPNVNHALPFYGAARLIEAPKAEPAPEAKAPLAEYCLSGEHYAEATGYEPHPDHSFPPGGDQWTRAFWRRMAKKMQFLYETMEHHPRNLPWFLAEPVRGGKIPEPEALTTAKTGAFDPSKPYRTRGGASVRELHVFENGTMTGLRGGCRIPTVWAADGTFSQHTPGSDYDLVNEPPTTRKAWVNIYPNSTDAFLYDSQEEADKAADDDRLAGKAFLIEWQE